MPHVSLCIQFSVWTRLSDKCDGKDEAVDVEEEEEEAVFISVCFHFCFFIFCHFLSFQTNIKKSLKVQEAKDVEQKQQQLVISMEKKMKSIGEWFFFICENQVKILFNSFK